MKWFKRMITRWVQEDQENNSQIDQDKKASGITISRSSPDTVDGHAGLNITVINAIGGKIITFRYYDRRKDDNQFRHYVIPEDMDFERELGKMITMESMRG